MSAIVNAQYAAVVAASTKPPTATMTQQHTVASGSSTNDPTNTEQAGESVESEKPPQRKRTGKSLADLLKQQEASGFVPPSPEAPKGPRRYDGNRNRGQNQGGYVQHQPQYERGNFQQHEQATWDMPGEAGDQNSTLNWQQQELLRRDSGRGRGRSRQPGSAFGGGRQRYPQQGQPAFGGGQQQGFRQHPGNWQQPRNPGYQQPGSAFGGYNGGGQQGGPRRRMPDNVPEWADDSLFQDTSGASNSAGLNWQQQSLMKRDETDPFLHLVRGENEYIRE